jgi:sulfide:quinone oxidoreductase
MTDTPVSVGLPRLNAPAPALTAMQASAANGVATPAGWQPGDDAIVSPPKTIDVDQASLQHIRHANVFGLWDASYAPIAKTMAAARKQAPVVAENLIAVLVGKAATALYDGYGSCPLTVERGKVLLAEYGYGGKLLPSFPSWDIEATKPQRLSWLLKTKVLPWVYWNGMLKGREWMAHPQHCDAE